MTYLNFRLGLALPWAGTDFKVWEGGFGNNCQISLTTMFTVPFLPPPPATTVQLLPSSPEYGRLMSLEPPSVSTGPAGLR